MAVALDTRRRLMLFRSGEGWTFIGGRMDAATSPGVATTARPWGDPRADVSGVIAVLAPTRFDTASVEIGPGGLWIRRFGAQSCAAGVPRPRH